MGNSKSQVAENNGNVVNDIVIQPATIENDDLKMCIYVIAIICVLNFCINIYKMWYKNVKKNIQRAQI